MEINSEKIPKHIAIIMRCKKAKYNYFHLRTLLKLCKKKKFTFLISANYRIAKAIGADGVHYPRNVNNARKDKSILTTCSFHGYKDYRRAKRLFADLIFISPIFQTKSDISKKELGLIKISLLANYAKYKYSVLGGVKNNNINSLRNRGINSISGLEFICEIIQ